MIEFNFFGDFSLNKKSPTQPLKSIKNYLDKADVNFLNLEGPLLTKAQYHEDITCFSSVDSLKIIEAYNFNLISLANNHITDFSLTGLTDTINLLKNANIHFSGAGPNLEEALKPCEFKVKGKKFGLLSFGWETISCKIAKKNKFGVAPLEEKVVLKEIKKQKHKFDFLIISLHFGYERDIYPAPSQREMLRKFIDQGADIIIGHGPHFIQGIEEYKNKYIVYSLGNFLFADIKTSKFDIPWEENAKNSFILNLTLSERLETISIKKIPFKYDSDLKIIDLYCDDKSNEKFLKKIDYLSSPLSLNDREYKKFWYNNSLRKLPNPVGLHWFDRSRILLSKAFKILLKVVIDK